MKRKIILFTVLVVIVLAFLANQTNFFSLYTPGGTYYIPMYTTVRCDVTENDYTHSFDLKQDTNNLGGWLPFITSNRDLKIQCGGTGFSGNFMQGCTYEIRKNDASFGIFVSDSEGRDYGSLANVGFGQYNSGQISLPAGGWVEIKYTGADNLLETGDVKLTMTGDMYGLITTSGTGFYSTTTTCDANQLARNSKMPACTTGQTPAINNCYDPKVNLQMQPGQYQSFVSGQIAVKSPLDVVNINGQAVYIQGPGGYNPTFTGDDGNIYVDVRTYIPDSGIICLPSNQLYCSADGRSIIPGASGKYCDQYVGGVADNSYVQKDSTTWCKLTCDTTMQKLVYTSDCKILAEQCPADKPYRDWKTLECVANPVVPPQNNGNSNIGLYIIIGALVLGFGYYVYKRK